MIPLFLMGLVTLMFSEMALSAVDRVKIDLFSAVTIYLATLMYLGAMLRIAVIR